MAIHTLAYHINQIGGTLSELTPVPDPTVTINVEDIQVPASYNKLVRAAASGGASATTHFQLQSPSLRGLYFPDFSNFSNTASFSNPGEFVALDNSPLELVTNEGLSFWFDGGGATAADAYGIVFLSDGAISPALGKFRTIRGTLAASAAATTWNSSAITFDQTLPVGSYDVVGMRVEGAALVAARLIFVGQYAVTRPGCLAQNAASDVGQVEFRYGNPGVLGNFPSTNPPSVEVLGGTSTAQVVYLDLIKRS